MTPEIENLGEDPRCWKLLDHICKAIGMICAKDIKEVTDEEFSFVFDTCLAFFSVFYER